MGGKKGRKYRNKKKRNEERKQAQAPYQENFTLTTVELGNIKMEAYYALQGIHNHCYNNNEEEEDGESQLVPCTSNEEKEAERLRWRTRIGKILPASFRTAFDISESLKEKLEKELEELVKAQAKAAAEAASAAEEATDEAKKESEAGYDKQQKATTRNEEDNDIDENNNKTAIQKIPFLPHAYQFLDINRKTIRKDPTMKDLFDWMKKQTEAGFITRQETVSMIPPVVLAPNPDDCVLDMCAAPGSKTCQILERLSPKGSMVANDSSYQRAYMLVNQLKRILHNNPVVLVTSAEAQFFPQSLSFDRILADVPCSGDGTTRKNIGIWKQWSQLGALALHALQLDIAWKGVAMLKVGGYMCYSTCSYNPIENEAVVAELLRRAKGSLELVDAPLEGFKVRPGMNHWHVLAEEKSKRQMMNEKKKNNAKMKQRKAEWEEKQKQKQNDNKQVVDASNGNGNVGDDESTQIVEGEKGENGSVKAPESKAAAGTVDKTKDTQGDNGEKNTSAAANEGVTKEATDGGEQQQQEPEQVTRPKFEPPTSWDDETLIGLAKDAGLMHFKTIDDVPSQLRKRVKKSCFPPTEEEAKELHLEKCIRCLSHDNDTGGFFIALLKKTAPISSNEAKRIRRSVDETKTTTATTDNGTSTGPDLKRMKLDDKEEGGATAAQVDDNNDEKVVTNHGDEKDENADEEMEDYPSGTSTKPRREVKSNRLEDGKGGKHKDVGRDDFVPVDAKLFEPLIDFFGFSDSFPKDQIMTRAIGDSKVLYYLARSVKENFIDHGIQQRVTIIGSGLKAFVRNTNWGSDCEYRLSQEAIHFILPYMSKRKVVVDMEDFNRCISGDAMNIQLSKFSEEFSKAATDFSGGPFVALLRGYETNYTRKLFLVMWRCRGTSVNCMVSKAEIEGIKSKLAALKEET